MNKPALYTAAVLVAGVLIYLGSVLIIGWQVESAITSIEADMIQSDELIVHRFEYESGFGRGVLSYDLELSPVVGGVAGELLAEIAAIMGELHARRSKLELTHGPWVGDGMGFAAAGTKLEFSVGDGFRQLLPQYPGTAPAATVYASVSLGGSANLRLEMLAYDGRLVMEDEPISLTVAGVSAGMVLSGDDVSVGFDVGTVKLSDGATGFLVDGMALGLETSGSVSELAMTFDLDELSVSDADSETQLDVQSIAGSGASKSFLPRIWLGENDFHQTCDASDGRDAVEALNIRVFGAIDEDADGLLAASSLLNISEFMVAEVSVDGIELGVSYENINSEALSDFIELSEQFDVASVDADELLGTLLSMVNALSADGPTLTVSPIAISLVESGDTSAAFSVGFSGIDVIEEATAEELFEAMNLSGEFSITADAIRKLIEIGLTSSEDALSAQELESAVDSGYQQLISAIEGSRFSVSTDRGLSTRVDVSGGAMQINGEETEAGAELLVAALSRLGLRRWLRMSTPLISQQRRCMTMCHL